MGLGCGGRLPWGHGSRICLLAQDLAAFIVMKRIYRSRSILGEGASLRLLRSLPMGRDFLPPPSLKISIY